MTRRFLSILFCIALLLYACSNKKARSHVIVFKRVDNLNIGSEIKLHGLVVGKVSGLQLTDTGVLVRINLKEDKQIPTGSTITLINPLLGAAFINIEPSGSPTYLAESDTLYGIYAEKGLLDNLLSDSLDRKRIRDALDTLIAGLKGLAGSNDSTPK